MLLKTVTHIINQNSLMCSPMSLFSTSVQRSQFPYLIGGIGAAPHSPEVEKIITMLFTPNVFDGFKQAYQAILSAFQQRDQHFLKDIFEPNLTNNLSIPPLKLINKDSQIKAYPTAAHIILGGKFIRNGTENLKLMQKNLGVHIYNDMFNAMQQIKQRRQLSIQLPIVFGVQIAFESSLKLVEASAQVSDSVEECHTLQFELENQISMNQIMKMMGTNNASNMQWMNELMFGKDYEWRIADVDNALNGNMKIQ